MRSTDARFAVRPPVRLRRDRLSEREIERIRRERREPRITQWDYLHLSGLKRGITSSVRLLSAEGPVLDLFCGTKPYLELIPWRPFWGLDLDVHFGRADVLGALPLPFSDGAFGVVFCSQALYLVDDPIRTVQEIARVLKPGGHVIVTIPHLFSAEGWLERRWTREDLGILFGAWDEVRIAGVDGPGAALAFFLGRLATRAARRWRVVRLPFTAGIVVLNSSCRVLDVLTTPLHRRWPHSLMLVARRPPMQEIGGSGRERTTART